MPTSLGWDVEVAEPGDRSSQFHHGLAMQPLTFQYFLHNKPLLLRVLRAAIALLATLAFGGGLVKTADPSCDCSRWYSVNAGGCGGSTPTVAVTWDPTSHDGFCAVEPGTAEYCWPDPDCLFMATFVITAAPGTSIGLAGAKCNNAQGTQGTYIGECGAGVPGNVWVVCNAAGVVCNFTISKGCSACVG